MDLLYRGRILDLAALMIRGARGNLHRPNSPMHFCANAHHERCQSSKQKNTRYRGRSTEVGMDVVVCNSSSGWLIMRPVRPQTTFQWSAKRLREPTHRIVPPQTGCRTLPISLYRAKSSTVTLYVVIHRDFPRTYTAQTQTNGVRLSVYFLSSSIRHRRAVIAIIISTLRARMYSWQRRRENCRVCSLLSESRSS